MPLNDNNQYAGRLEQLMRRAASSPSQETRPTAAPESVYVPPAYVPPVVTQPVVQQPVVPYDFLAAPRDVADTGLPESMIEDHIIRTLYFANEMAAAELTQECGLSYSILSELLKSLSKDLYVEVKGQRGVGDAGYIYTLTGKGKARALECLQKTWYRGPLPVPLDRYIEAIKVQTVRNVVVTAETIRSAFAELIIKDKILDQLGPAMNSGSSLFLFGAPGNGKTAIAERLSRLMGDSIYIPRAIEVDGYVIKLFDTLSHREIDDPIERLRDGRWARIRRPVVMVGGELTMAGLDLLWNDVGRFYEAPLQMKANGGIFFIDDFGRQIVRPVDLLNRWIVPLEKRIDFLTLMTGKKIEVPFDELLVFSTNLNPEDLADEAFLRRIKFKVNVEDPDLPQFVQIMQLVCQARGVTYSENGLYYMLEKWWEPSGRPLRMCQPRDILDQLIAIARYLMREPALEPDLLDRACHSYFISQKA
jgi:DNA-binding MarR family transcriptional regulator